MDARVGELREDLVRFNRRIRTTGAGHRLTPTQVQALAHLDRIGPMSARKLADIEMVAPQTIARTVSFLEGQGLVERAADPHDARSTLITVTDLGRRTLQIDRNKHSEWLAAVLKDRCTPTERELLFLAGSLLRRLAEDEEPTPTAPIRTR